MKERVTFLLHVGEEGFDPAKLNVGKDGLTVPPIKAAKEHRITFGLSELTQEVSFPSPKADLEANTDLCTDMVCFEAMS